MNREIVFLQSQIACAYIELEAMKIENAQRLSNGLSPAYGEEQISNIIDKYGLGHNSVIVALNKGA